MRTLWIVALTLCCNLVEPTGDAGSPPEEGGVDATEEGRGPDGDQSPLAGSLTQVIEEQHVVIDRLCDIDGDGNMDNGIDDLGAVGAILAGMLDEVIVGEYDVGARNLIHFPWVDDLSIPDDRETTVVLFEGDDENDDGPEDDFSGSERFFCRADSLDDCGEPRFYFLDARIDDGVLTTEGGSSFSIRSPGPAGEILIRGARIGGAIHPEGAVGEYWLCGFASIHELGRTPGFEEAGDLTMLEIFLAGGAVFGMPVIPGLDPDLDLDGDGLERFTLDINGHIDTCIDGDGSSELGRECWQSENMADGFSWNMSVRATPARFGGLVVGWDAGRTCDNPPATSIWESP